MTNPFIDHELLRLHHLIKIRGTGSPEILAKKLECSERTARHKIEQLRKAGLPIAYCKQRHSYYYTEEVSINVSLILGASEMHKIVGGTESKHLMERYQNNSLTADFLPCNSRDLFL